MSAARSSGRSASETVVYSSASVNKHVPCTNWRSAVALTLCCGQAVNDGFRHVVAESNLHALPLPHQLSVVQEHRDERCGGHLDEQRDENGQP